VELVGAGAAACEPTNGHPFHVKHAPVLPSQSGLTTVPISGACSPSMLNRPRNHHPDLWIHRQSRRKLQGLGVRDRVGKDPKGSWRCDCASGFVVRVGPLRPGFPQSVGSSASEFVLRGWSEVHVRDPARAAVLECSRCRVRLRFERSAPGVAPRRSQNAPDMRALSTLMLLGAPCAHRAIRARARPTNIQAPGGRVRSASSVH
jgi:hypothetical protein